MPSHDEFSSLEQAVAAELHRLMATTEPALRKAVTGDAGEITADERWESMAQIVTGLSNVIINLARVIDRLAEGNPEVFE
jgi:hypothetical protein